MPLEIDKIEISDFVVPIKDTVLGTLIPDADLPSITPTSEKPFILEKPFTGITVKKGLAEFYPERARTSGVFPSTYPASQHTELMSVAFKETVIVDVGAFTVIEVPYDVYTLEFEDGITIDVWVNTELGESGFSQDLATKFGQIFAQLPPSLRDFASDNLQHFEVDDYTTILAGFRHDNTIIFDVDFLTTGDDQSLLNTFLHEIGHAVGHKMSPDGELFYDVNEYSEARIADGIYPSTYAGTKPREDFAETFALWYRVRTGEITGHEAALVEKLFSNRFDYFDNFEPAFDALPGEAQRAVIARNSFKHEAEGLQEEYLKLFGF